MLKAPAMILDVKGPSNQHCIGGGGGMREFAVFLPKCPKTFGQDCRFSHRSLGTRPSDFQPGGQWRVTTFAVSLRKTIVLR